MGHTGTVSSKQAPSAPKPLPAEGVAVPAGDDPQAGQRLGTAQMLQADHAATWRERLESYRSHHRRKRPRGRGVRARREAATHQAEVTAQMLAEAKEHNANRSDAVAYLMREHDVTQTSARTALKGVYSRRWWTPHRRTARPDREEWCRPRSNGIANIANRDRCAQT